MESKNIDNTVQGALLVLQRLSEHPDPVCEDAIETIVTLLDLLGYEVWLEGQDD